MREDERRISIDELEERAAIEAERLHDAPLRILNGAIHPVGRQVDELRSQVGQEGLESKSILEIGADLFGAVQATACGL